MTIDPSRILRKEVLVPATREEIWHAWTTTEGITSFFAPEAKIELWPGGAFELYFRLNNPEGERGSEGCKVISFYPMDYVSFTWNAPPEYATVRHSGDYARVIVEIDRHDDELYKVTLTHLDFGEGEEWGKVYEYFDHAWDSVLANLKEKFAEETLNE
jgi:uncharacterized protein YndB with AHSA1/START domain